MGFFEMMLGNPSKKPVRKETIFDRILNSPEDLMLLATVENGDLHIVIKRKDNKENV